MKYRWIVFAILEAMAGLGTYLALREWGLISAETAPQIRSTSSLIAFGIMILAIICLMIVRQNDQSN